MGAVTTVNTLNAEDVDLFAMGETVRGKNTGLVLRLN